MGLMLRLLQAIKAMPFYQKLLAALETLQLGWMITDMDDQFLAADAMMNRLICDEVYKRTNVTLDPASPLSKASISNGIGNKIGIPLRDVFDKEMLIEDIAAGIAMRINTEYGTQITTVWPPAVFIPQLENAIIDYVILQLEGQRPGTDQPVEYQE